MSDYKLEQSYLNKLSTISQLSDAIFRSLNHKTFFIAEIEKDLKYFLKECRKIKLINYPVTFFSSEISKENLQSALDAVLKKIASFAQANDSSPTQDKEVSILVKIKGLLFACQEKLYIKKTLAESAEYYEQLRRLNELRDILQIAKLFRDEYLIFSDQQKFMEKYQSEESVNEFKISIKNLYFRFHKSCCQAEVLASNIMETPEVLGGEDKKHKINKNNFETIKHEIKKKKAEIKMKKSVDSQAELDELLSSLESAIYETEFMYKNLKEYIESYVGFLYGGPIEAQVADEASEIDEEHRNLNLKLIKTLNKDIRNIVEKLNVDNNIDLRNFSEEVLMHALLQAASENMFKAAFSIFSYFESIISEPRNKFISDSKKRKIAAYLDDIDTFSILPKWHQITWAFNLFREEYLLHFRDEKNFFKKYPLYDGGDKKFKNSIKKLCFEFIVACARTGLLLSPKTKSSDKYASPSSAPLNYSNRPNNRYGNNANLVMIDINDFEIITREIKRKKSGTDVELNELLDSIESATQYVKRMYIGLEEHTKEIYRSSASIPEEDKKNYELKRKRPIVYSLTKDIDPIIRKLNVDNNKINLSEFDEKVLMRMLKRAVIGNMDKAAFSILDYYDYIVNKHNSGFFSSSRKARLEVYQNRIAAFLFSQSKSGNLTAQALLQSFNFLRSERDTLVPTTTEQSVSRSIGIG